MDEINYPAIMKQAIQGVISAALDHAAQHGLPGKNHFVINFDTTHPKVNIPVWLREKYPDKMTIITQHWFENLKVDSDGFRVTLNFGDKPQDLYVAFDSINSFLDPSVNFGLHFAETQMEDQESDEAATSWPPEAISNNSSSKVVSLDSFRKDSKGKSNQ